ESSRGCSSGRAQAPESLATFGSVPSGLMTMRPLSQQASAGSSCPSIVAAALACADPRPGLRWVDIGCGTGELLRAVRDQYSPAKPLWDRSPAMAGRGPQARRHAAHWPRRTAARRTRARRPGVARGDHLSAPWDVLRTAARLVVPGGRIVITT